MISTPPLPAPARRPASALGLILALGFAAAAAGVEPPGAASPGAAQGGGTPPGATPAAPAPLPSPTAGPLVATGFRRLPSGVTGGKAYAAAMGDFNGDGRPDLAMANGAVLLNQGDGSFPTERQSGAYMRDDAVATGDFNGDGRLDLATVNADHSTVTVLLNQGNGTLPTAGAPVYAVGPDPCGIVAADFNGDGRLDLATASVFNTVTLLLNQGDGTFPATGAPAYPTGAPGGIPYALTVGDFNGDGRPDLATANANTFMKPPQPGTVSVLLNQGNGVFPAAGWASYALGGTPYGLATGDFDNDGRLDLATANKDTNTVTVLLNQGQGRFATNPASYAVGGSPKALAVADLDGDGRPDLAAANYVDGTVTVLLNQGGGVFPATGGLTLPVGDPGTQGGNYPGTVLAGDFDGDGRPDLATTNFGTGTVTVQRNTPPRADAAPGASLPPRATGGPDHPPKP